jgi:restriction endonuclease
MEESKQQTAEEIAEHEMVERTRQRHKQEVAARIRKDALTDLMKEAQTATTGQLKTVADILRELKRRGQNYGRA